jgi:methionyl-tRNA synthetase
MKKKYITTPIYYVNDKPHIGHAYTTVAADVLARYYKAKEDEAFLLTGTDEHGAKIAEAAKAAGAEPKDFVDSLVPQFETAWKNLNIEYDQFFRTTNPEHEKVVQEFVGLLSERGFVEKRKYEGLYCVGCERFLQKDELVDGRCPDHGKEPVAQSEENYFFLLSKMGGKVKAAIEKGEMQVCPESRKNEVLGKIDQGLEDVSISRKNVEWGIKFPGDETQTIYVWVDALINYFSEEIIYQNKKAKIKNNNDGNYSNLKAGSWKLKAKSYKLWPADLHLMAKDILWFHAIVWPAMLLALDLPLPKKVFAHGFFTVEGLKMSKTVGNVLDPNDLVKKFGADAVRYALLREFPFGEDGDISEEKIAERYNKDLANGLGNLVNRTLTMMNKYNVINKKAEIKNNNDIEKIKNCVEKLDFYGALVGLGNIVNDQNAYIDKEKPWELAKSNADKLSQVLNSVYQVLVELAEIILPFMPDTTGKMKGQLESLKPEPLFPRLD